MIPSKNKIWSVIVIACIFGLLALVITVNALRFTQLEEVPPGFQVDEIIGATTAMCFESEGTDAYGNQTWPLFFVHFNYVGSPKPSTFIYPAIGWIKIFGSSIVSFRAFIAFVVLLTIIGTSLLAAMIFGRYCALWVVVMASISPWAWMFSRIAYESMVGPLLMIWGLVAFFRTDRIWGAIFSGVLLSAAMISYPPLRLQIPLLIGTILIYKGVVKRLSWPYALIFVFVISCFFIPLAKMILFDGMQSRFSNVGIISEEYLSSIGKSNSVLDLFTIFVGNYLKHFSWSFLVTKGAENIIGSTQIIGILSWPETVVFGAAIFWLVVEVVRRKGEVFSFSKEKGFLILVIVNILIGFIPVALTWEGLPNALRPIGSWPFVALLSGYLISSFSQRWAVCFVGFTVLSCVASFMFLNFYFTQYSQLAWGMFSPWTKKWAIEAVDDKKKLLEFVYRNRHQDYTAQFYLMTYHGYSCSESRKFWNIVRRASKLPKI